MNFTAELLKSKGMGIMPNDGPICPYCKKPSVLKNERAIYNQHFTNKLFWVCCDFPKCDAYVGTHGNGIWMNYPMGRLANKELRELKKKAHELFDHIWKTATMSRTQMYVWFQKTMSLDEQHAHIGELDVDQCYELIEHLNILYGNIKIKS